MIKRLIPIFSLFLLLAISSFQATGQSQIFYGNLGTTFTDKPTVIVDNNAGSITININPGGAYAVQFASGQSSWVSVANASLVFRESVTFNYNANMGAPRSENIVLVGQNSQTDFLYISISQRDGISNFNVSEQRVTIGANGAAKKVDITNNSGQTNATLDIIEDFISGEEMISSMVNTSDWLTVSLVGNELTFSCTPIGSNDPERIAQVHVLLGDMLIAINIVQNTIPVLNISTETLTLTGLDLSANLLLSSNETVNWEIISPSPIPSWLSISNTGGTVNYNMISQVGISCSANTTSSSNSTVLTFQWIDANTEVAYTKDITVIQEPTPFIDVTPFDLNKIYQAGSENYTITSNVSWSVTPNENWLNKGFRMLDGTNGTQIINIDSYTGDGNPRVGTISFKTDDGLVEEIRTIVQASPLVFNIAESLDFDDKGGNLQFSIFAHIEWELVSAPCWVDLDIFEGTTTGVTYNINVAAEPNNQYAERTGNIIIRGTLGEDVLVTKYIPVSQNIPNITAYTGATTNKNYVSTTVYGEAGRVLGHSISYSDNLGKPIQSISQNMSNYSITVMQTLYDNFGRPDITTMPIPLPQTSMEFREDFADETNFPGTSDEMLSYYSNSNTDEPFVPADNSPYSQVIYSRRIPGAVQRSYMVGEATFDKYSLAFTVTASADELLKHNLSETGNVNLSTLTTQTTHPYSGNEFLGMTKAISRDVMGKESISYYDAEGRVIASCMSGESGAEAITVSYKINSNENPEGGYIDIHLPNNNASYTLLKTGTWDHSVIDLAEEFEENEEVDYGYGTDAFAALNPGFYRIITTSATEVSFTATIGYKYYSFNAYDEAGRLMRTISPKDVIELQSSATDDATLDLQCSQNTYNSLGWLLSSYSKDEGTTRYLYRKDGKIRFSQNAKQRAEQKFSYTNYDKHGRTLEVGEYNDAIAEGYFLQQQDIEDSPNLGAIVNYEYETYTGLVVNGGTDAFASTDQTYSYYGHSEADAPRTQNFLRGKVSKTRNSNVTTWYSYTYNGLVEWVIQELKGLDLDKDGTVNTCTDDNTVEDSDDLVTLDYNYDYLGNVTEVIYQQSKDDEFTHHYTYDLDNRLIEVHTKDKEQIESKQAEYHYYPHGPLKRVELGKNIQGIDYVYNIQGWLKSINTPALNETDPGNDGFAGKNNNFEPDVFGMGLDYYTNDYKNLGFEICSYTERNNYDGNIARQRWGNKIFDDDLGEGIENTWSYYYDERNYLAQAEYGTSKFGNVGQTFYTGSFTKDANSAYTVYGATLGTNIVYDANGNIKQLGRNMNYGTAMDKLTYNYILGSNQLNYIQDNSGEAVKGIDFKGHTATAYTYNAIGQLEENTADDQLFTYDVYGKTKTISEKNVPTNKIADYEYDDRGFRVKKYDHKQGIITYYVRDVSGNIITTYEQAEGDVLKRTQVPIYGSGRLGMANIESDNTLKNHSYELSDHLGNVRATMVDNYDASIYQQLFKTIDASTDVVASKTIQLKPGFSTNNQAFTAAIDANTPSVTQENVQLTATDYYPFGMEMPGRSFNLGDYRFGYQGQFAEKDEETGYNQFEARLYDARIGRWLTTDPAGQYWSPYLGMGNNPVSGIDPDGMFTDWFYYQAQGESEVSWHWQAGNTATYTDVNGNLQTTSNGFESLLLFDITHVNNEGAYEGTLTWFGNSETPIYIAEGVFSGNINKGFTPIEEGNRFMDLSIRSQLELIDTDAGIETKSIAKGIQYFPKGHAIYKGNLHNSKVNEEWGSGRIRLSGPRSLYLHGKTLEKYWTHGCVCDKEEFIFKSIWQSNYSGVIPFNTNYNFK